MSYSITKVTDGTWSGMFKVTCTKGATRRLVGFVLLESDAEALGQVVDQEPKPAAAPEPEPKPKKKRVWSSKK